MKKMIKFVATVVALTLIGIPAIKVVVRTVLADEPITTVQNTKEAVTLTEATETTTAPTANTVDVDTSASTEVNSASTEVNQVNQATSTTSSDSNVQLDENGKYTPNYKSINSKEDLDKMWDEAESNPSQFGGKGRVPEEPTPSEPSKPEEPKPSKPSEPSEPTPSKPEEPKSSSSEEPKSSSSEVKKAEVKEEKKPLPTAGLPVTGEEKIVDYAMMATGFIILLFTMRYTTVISFLKGKYKI